MILLYHLFRHLFRFGVHISALRNGKAKRWIEGRENWQNVIRNNWKLSANERVIWMHCASVGEFEQGRPLLEAIRKKDPSVKLVLTFFSPSGYDMHHQYEGVDLVTYLPFDGKKNADEFIDMIRPSLVIFVKYEFWYFYLSALKSKQIPVILASGLFRNSQPFFQSWGAFHRKMLSCFTFFFVQDKNSVQLLQSIGIEKNVLQSGDTRFDRVAEIAAEPYSFPLLESFAKNKLLIAGSTWPEDEKLLRDWHQLQQDWRLVIVPHEISASHLASLRSMFPLSKLLSEINPNEKIDIPVLIIDTMGLLSRIYRYATLCYVGGGLKKSGHHNILEAAVFGKAVVTGPHINKFSESVAIHQAGGSFIVRNGKDLNAITQNEAYMKAGEIALEFVRRNTGATNKMMEWLKNESIL